MNKSLLSLLIPACAGMSGHAQIELRYQVFFKPQGLENGHWLPGSAAQ